MSNLIFYTHPQSRGRMVRWMLEEVGADYTTNIVNYGPEMKSPAYLAINPMGKVPAIRHKGTIITECAAICAYLADAFPEAGLAPPNSDRGDYYRWLFFGAGPIEASVTDKALKVEPSAEQSRFVGYGTFDHVMATLDSTLSGRPYICGERFSAADVYVGSQITFGLMLKTIPETPVFHAYADRLTSRDAYKRAGELDEDAAAAG